MIVARLCLMALLAFPVLAPAQKREIQELQRDMALMQDQVRAMRSAIDEKMAALTVLVEQTLDRISKVNTAVVVLESTVGERLQEHEKSLATPVAGLGSKVDRMADEFQFVRESIADVNSRIGKLQTQITDLRNAIQIMQSPPLPPGEGAAAPTASAETLFNNARRDQSGGKMDLALAQYEDYLRLFGNTDLAPTAQYNIGDIYYGKADYSSALKAFDLVLEKYPENEKTADAMYMKGMSLAKAGQETAAVQELRALLKKYPNSPLASKAAADLKTMESSASGTRR